MHLVAGADHRLNEIVLRSALDRLDAVLLDALRLVSRPDAKRSVSGSDSGFGHSDALSAGVASSPHREQCRAAHGAALYRKPGHRGIELV